MHTFLPLTGTFLECPRLSTMALDWTQSLILHAEWFQYHLEVLFLIPCHNVTKVGMIQMQVFPQE